MKARGKTQVDIGEDEEKVNVTRCNHSAGVKDVLAVFNPVRGTCNIEEYISKLEEYRELCGWNEVEVRHFALSNLDGVAKSWRDSLPAGKRSWDEWKLLLRNTFPCRKSVIELRLTAQNYKQSYKQDVMEYVYEKITKCNKASMQEREMIKWIVDGLQNQRYRDFLGPFFELSNNLSTDRGHCKHEGCESD